MSTDSLTPVPSVEEPSPPPPNAPGDAELRRRTDRALVGGVCAGIAEYLGVESLVVRVGFVLVAAASGIGLVIYPLAWVLIPAEEWRAWAGNPRPWRQRLAGWREALGIALLVLVALLALRRAGLWLGDAVVLPLVLASSGLALIVRQARSSEWVPGEGRHHQGSTVARAGDAGRAASSARY